MVAVLFMIHEEPARNVSNSAGGVLLILHTQCDLGDRRHFVEVVGRIKRDCGCGLGGDLGRELAGHGIIHNERYRAELAGNDNGDFLLGHCALEDTVMVGDGSLFRESDFVCLHVADRFASFGGDTRCGATFDVDGDGAGVFRHRLVIRRASGQDQNCDE